MTSKIRDNLNQKGLEHYVKSGIRRIVRWIAVFKELRLCFNLLHIIVWLVKNCNITCKDLVAASLEYIYNKRLY